MSKPMTFVAGGKAPLTAKPVSRYDAALSSETFGELIDEIGTLSERQARTLLALARSGVLAHGGPTHAGAI